MAIVKRSNNGGLMNYSTLLSDMFDPDKFFTNDLLADNFMPAVNVSETDKNYEIELAAPGYKKEDFKVDVSNGILNISAETKMEKEEKGKDYTRREFAASSFSRGFSLPENEKQEDINAKYENGILKLSVDKKKIEAPKKAEIKVA